MHYQNTYVNVLFSILNKNIRQQLESLDIITNQITGTLQPVFKDVELPK